MIRAAQIPKQIIKAIRLLNEHNYEAYLVGGSVRDLLQAKIPADFDLTTSATPEQNMRVFSEYQTIPVGLKYGTIKVIIDQMPVEITTYRVEQGYSDHRHPDTIKFSTDLKQDLSRRDFTINALAFHPEEGLVDPFSGYHDLNNKIIRTVGQPEERFSEDALRILRALRFASSLNFAIDQNTKIAIKSHQLLLKNIAVERINQEFSQIMVSSNINSILTEYRDLFAVFIPELRKSFDFEQRNPYHAFDVFRHTVEVISNTPPQLDLRLAALYHDLGKPDTFSIDDQGIGHFYNHPKKSAQIARTNMQELKFEKKLIDTVETLVLYHDYPLELDKTILKRRLHKFGEKMLDKLITLKKADTMGKAKTIQTEQVAYLNEISLMIDQIVRTKPALQITDLEIDGNDAIRLGLQGPEIGRALGEIFELVLTEQLENKRKPLLEVLKSLAQK